MESPIITLTTDWGESDFFAAAVKGRLYSMIPSVNETLCIGCGACEHLCPVRPVSAIQVEGHEVHKHI